MTDPETEVFNEIVERMKAVLGRKPTMLEWREQACNIILTQRALISRGSVRADPITPPTAPRTRPEAIVIPGELQAP